MWFPLSLPHPTSTAISLLSTLFLNQVPEEMKYVNLKALMFSCCTAKSSLDPLEGGKLSANRTDFLNVVILRFHIFLVMRGICLPLGI